MTADAAYDVAFLITSPPNAGYLGQETFDWAVAGGVFDQRILVIFAQQGLLHLAASQAPEGKKSLSKLWQSAELFGIERFVALLEGSEAWPPSGWAPSPLLAQAEAVPAAKLRDLLQVIPRVVVV